MRKWSVCLSHLVFMGSMVILIIVMGKASCQFTSLIDKDPAEIRREDSLARLKYEKIEPIEINIEYVTMPPTDTGNKQKAVRVVTVGELNRIMDSINSKILGKQEQIIKRQDDLVNDIRQETNNNLDKHSAWLAFWITILGFVGVVSPIAYQMMQAKSLEEKVEGTRRNFEKIQEAYTLKMEMLSFETLILNDNLEYGADLRRLYIDSVKRHFKEFVSLIDADEKKWEDEKIHICNVLVNLEVFLKRLLRDAKYDEQISIRDLIDKIQNMLQPLVKSLKYSDIEDSLSNVRNSLTKI